MTLAPPVWAATAPENAPRSVPNSSLSTTPAANADMETDGLSKDEVEDPVHEALEKAGLGEVTGGGIGSGVALVDVEVTNEGWDRALLLLRRVLREIHVPRSTVIHQHDPIDALHGVY